MRKVECRTIELDLVWMHRFTTHARLRRGKGESKELWCRYKFKQMEAYHVGCKPWDVAITKKCAKMHQGVQESKSGDVVQGWIYIQTKLLQVCLAKYRLRYVATTQQHAEMIHGAQESELGLWLRHVYKIKIRWLQLSNMHCRSRVICPGSVYCTC